MVTEAAADELYRRYDTLKAIGYTTEEAKSFLGGVENAAQSQTILEPKMEPDTVVECRAQRSEPKRSAFRGFLLVARGYVFVVCIYAVAMQLFYPNSIYRALATWLPIRLDYFGEAAFISSFIVATALIMWKPRLSLRSGRHQAKPAATPST
jgi:hypothetical protein